MKTTPRFRLHISQPDGEKRVHEIGDGVTIIGRSKDSHVCLLFKEVSRQHARIDNDGEQCRIRDLNSYNGTRVKGEKIGARESVPLDHDDVIVIGPCALTFEQIPDPAKLPEEEAPPTLDTGDVAPEPVPPSDKPQRVVELGGPGGMPPWEPPTRTRAAPAEQDPIPPGVSTRGSRYLLDYLPSIYDPEATNIDFLSRFLALFESILMPIKWTAGNFDLCLDHRTAPEGFLPWLAGWLGITSDPTWDDAGRRRRLLREASWIYARRGTRPALRRVLAIYTGHEEEAIEIVDSGNDRTPYVFAVRLPRPTGGDQGEAQIRAVIEAHKPAHTGYTLEFGR